jgi:predicted XRE-type DNA-binding protein
VSDNIEPEMFVNFIFNDEYEIGSHGTIISHVGISPRIMKSSAKGKAGSKKKYYLHLALRGPGGQKWYDIHLLVAIHHCGGDRRSEGLVARHIDGNMYNNYYKNISWSIQLENIQDKKIHGTNLFGEKNHKSKITGKDATEIIRLYHCEGVWQKEIAKRFGITQSTVSNIVTGKIWQHLHDQNRDA